MVLSRPLCRRHGAGQSASRPARRNGEAPARLTPGAKHPIVAIDEHTNAVRAQSHRLPAHRRRADGSVQLAAGPASTAASSSCGLTTPTASATSTDAVRANPRRLPLDRHRLGRGPRQGRGHSAPIFSRNGMRLYDAAARQLLESGHVYRDYSTEAERAADKAHAEREKRAYRFRRKPISDAGAQRLRIRGQAVCACGSRFLPAASSYCTT